MPAATVGICASCGVPLRLQKEQFQERLEYMAHNNAQRLRTIPLRDPVCAKCANTIADLAKKHDFPCIAALEVVAKVMEYVTCPVSEREAKWHEVNTAIRRFGDITPQPELFP
jgi:hypothetical protein